LISERMNHFQAFIFDLDGVLVDTSAAHAEAYEDLWEALRIHGPNYEEIAGRRSEDVLSQYCRDLKMSRQELMNWTRFKQERARSYLMSRNLLFDDTIFSLRILMDQHVALALATAASARTTSLVLERYQLTDFFVAVITSEDVEKGKPAPDAYLEAIARIKMNPDRTLIVEDSQSGLISAIESGAFVASVRTHQTIEHERFIGAFDNLRTLITKIQE
jgi:HAD superfamily hydrolase (TIGR01509 family)